MHTNGAKRVLVAEDNFALANVVKFNLEKFGFDVTVAGNGREAWELVSHQPYDLIISDHQMPEMTGMELCQRIRDDERLRDIPFFLLTAKRLELDLNELADRLEITQTFSKPFSPSALVDVVRDQLSVARTTAGTI